MKPRIQVVEDEDVAQDEGTWSLEVRSEAEAGLVMVEDHLCQHHVSRLSWALDVKVERLVKRHLVLREEVSAAAVKRDTGGVSSVPLEG